MNKYISLYSALVLLFLIIAGNAQASTPELSFAGDYNYSYSDVTSEGFLTLTANLIGFQDLNIAPILKDSQFTLTSKFQSSIYGTSKTEGFFGSNVTQLSPWDFNIIGGDNANLLQGTINSLTMSGFNGFSFGLVSADLDAVTGDFVNDFNTGSLGLLGLVFNLSTPLSQDIFQTSFTGKVNGSLTAKTVNVVESSSGILMLVGLLGLFNRKLKINI